MDNKKKGWATIIGSVKSPLGFFSLVVLCAEAILAIVVSQVDRETARIITFLMAGILILTVICVLIIAIVKPRVIDPVDEAVKEFQINNNSDLIDIKLSDYEILQMKMREYSKRHHSSVVVLSRGERLIKKGDDATDMFLLESGNLIIDDETGRPVDEKELKYPGSIVGEAAVMGLYRKRTASVYVYSVHAKLIQMSRKDISDLAAYDNEFRNALQYLFKLHATRLEKVALYCGPGIKVNTESCSVVMGDIHGFSRLSARVTDEMACPFRFKFTDQSTKISLRYKGVFEDQGDGYKVIFRGDSHVERAAICSLEMQKEFTSLVKEFTKYDDTFNNTGFGIGICTDELTILTKPDGSEKILGHSINIAAAMSSYRESNNSGERKIYCSPESYDKLDKSRWKFDGPYIRILEKLGSKHQLYELTDKV